jgi:hypothetical protein
MFPSYKTVRATPLSVAAAASFPPPAKSNSDMRNNKNKDGNYAERFDLSGRAGC